MANSTAAADTESRRARQRRQLISDVTAEARQLLESGGRAAVGWREIAGKVGISPASLYTYFPSLDHLFAELILQSYKGLSTAIDKTLQSFAAAPIEDRVLAGPLAYRRWALANRGQFNLIFTDQIAGYRSEPGGPTVEAELAVFRPMATLLAQALGDDPRELTGNGPSLGRFVGLWGMFHGLASLEVNHHLDWLDPGRIYEDRVRWHLEHLGVAPASKVAPRLNRLAHLRTPAAR